MSEGKVPRLFARIAKSIAQFTPQTLRRLGRVMTADLLAKLDDMSAIAILEEYKKNVERHPNPLNKCGRKVFSQSDEDGITCEIVRRIGIERGVFAEFGVGDGLENNTIFLASLGWKGFWVGAQSLAYKLSPQLSSGARRNFVFLQEYIYKENILAFALHGLESIAEDHADVASLDLDGNDYFISLKSS